MVTESAYGDSVAGDLREGFASIASRSPAAAQAWYWRQAISIAAHYLPSQLRVTVDHLGRDLSYAARALRRAPLFTTIVALTLAIGIGANAAVIGVIDALYLRRLPVPHPESIVALYSADKRDRGHADLSNGGGGSAPNYRELRSLIHGVDGLALYAMQSLAAGDALAGEPTWSALVSGNYFQLLGVSPERGRFLQLDEDEPAGAHPVAVISDFLWREKFGADETIIGRRIPIGKTTFTIVGVAPKGFTGLHPEGRTNLWIPYTMEAAATGSSGNDDDRASRRFTIFGRLAQGATLAAVQTSADIAARELAAATPSVNRQLALFARIRDRLTTSELSGNGLRMFTLVWIMVALLHLVACTNVAGLMLARAAARRRELGVRICLGASRARILTQSLSEATLLAAIGAAGGLLVGRTLSALLANMQFLSASDPGLDLRVVMIVVVVAVGTVVQFGLLPALDAARSDPLAILRGGRRDTGARRRDRSEIVVITQIAVSVLLVANAAVFLGLFQRQTHAAPGYDVPQLLVASVALREGRSTRSDWAAAYDDAMERVSHVSGVRATAAAIGAPLFNTRWFGELSVPGQTSLADRPRQTSLQAVGPGYFAAIGAPLVRGREFTTNDRLTPNTPIDAFDVVIVNEALARQLWPGGDPLGKQLSLPRSPPATVVGVVRDLRDVSTIDVHPRAYFPLLETRFPAFDVVVRSSSSGASVAEGVRAALQASPLLRRPSLRTMSELRDGATSLSRAASSGLSICAALALLLTAVGLYGIVAMWASRRRSEIGIRLALGASTRSIHRLLLSGVGRLVGVGAALGLVCAFAVVQIERSWMGPILSLDALTIASSLAALGACAALAGFLPSRRATRQHPAEVLRSGD
jgi:predicted permease